MFLQSTVTLHRSGDFCLYHLPTAKNFILQCSYTTAYIMAKAYASVCSYARIRWQMLICVRGTLGIRRVRSKYADKRRCKVCFTQRPKYIHGHVQN